MKVTAFAVPFTIGWVAIMFEGYRDMSIAINFQLKKEKPIMAI